MGDRELALRELLRDVVPVEHVRAFVHEVAGRGARDALPEPGASVLRVYSDPAEVLVERGLAGPTDRCAGVFDALAARAPRGSTTGASRSRPPGGTGSTPPGRLP